MKECPPNTSRSACLQKDTNAVAACNIWWYIDVIIEPTQIVDCYQLGKFKFQQTRPRPILVKLQCAIDATTILANKISLSAPIHIKPDMSPAEQAIESILLNERRALIQGGYNSKSIKMNNSNNSLYVNIQIFGSHQLSISTLSNNYRPNPTVIVAADPPQRIEHNEPSITHTPANQNFQ